MGEREKGESRGRRVKEVAERGRAKNVIRDRMTSSLC